MSAPTFSPSAPTGTATPRAIPPYAGPASVSESGVFAGKVGPFVPSAERTRAGWGAASDAHEVPRTAVLNPTVSVVTVPTPVAAVPAIPPAAEPAAAAIEMSVPASIPPYRPLRPTPIVTPAIRTPLYIPPIPTPAGEAVVEDEGVIEPQLVHTSEFAVPASFTDLAPVQDVAAEDAPIEATIDRVEDGQASVPAAEVASELPWIDSFLANTPVMPMAAVVEPAVEQSGDAVSAAPESPVVDELPAFVADEVVAAPAAATEGDTEVDTEAEATVNAETDFVAGTAAEAPDAVAPETVDEWPLDEAAAEFRVLRDALDAQASLDAAEAGVHEEAAAAPHAELPEWSDDDMMDIMPIRHSGKTPLSNAAIPPDGELWAERARKAHEEAQVFRAMASNFEAGRVDEAAAPHTPDAPEVPAPQSTAEEAAHALELLARRVRAGELTLPSYDPRMGEPAALVAALAALLGVRLR